MGVALIAPAFPFVLAVSAALAAGYNLIYESQGPGSLVEWIVLWSVVMAPLAAPGYLYALLAPERTRRLPEYRRMWIRLSLAIVIACCPPAYFILQNSLPMSMLPLITALATVALWWGTESAWRPRPT